MKKGIKIKDDYLFFGVVLGLDIQNDEAEDFEEHLLAQCDVRAQYLETYETLPTLEDGKAVEGTGGRPDVIFAIHKDDVEKLSIVHRIDLSIIWLQEAIEQYPDLYEDRISDYLALKRSI